MGRYTDALKNGGLTAPEAPYDTPGRYVSRIRSVPVQPQGDPNKLNIMSNVDRAASAADLAKASMADDPQRIVQYLASKRFPRMPIEDAVARYGLDQHGRVFYQADDGNLYYEAPQDIFGSGNPLEAMGKSMAANAGPLIPAAAGMGVGIATAPLLVAGPAGAATSITATGMAAAAGEGFRQALGNKFLGDPIDAGPVYQEFGQNAFGQTLGLGAGKFMTRNTARDIARYDRPATEKLTDIARRHGVAMTPGQASGLNSQLSRERVLSNIDDSSGVMQDFFEKQKVDYENAFTSYLDDISRVDSPEVAGSGAKAASKLAMDRIGQLRASRATPLYLRAFKEAKPVNARAVVDQIDDLMKGTDNLSMGRRLADIRRKLYDSAGNLKTDVQSLHNVKVEIDNELSKKMSGSLGSINKKHLMDIKDTLLKQLDDASPNYAKARAIYHDLSAGVDEVREGILGNIANLPDDTAFKASEMLFSPNRVGPGGIVRAKVALQKVDPQAWQDVKRSFLQNQLNKALREGATTGSNPGVSTAIGKLRAALVGDTSQKKLLKAALEPDEYKALDDLMRIAKAVAQGPYTGSNTAFNQAIQKEFNRSATGRISKLLSPLDSVKAWLDELATGKKAAELAEIVTSPDGIARVKELRRLNPKTLRAAIVLDQLLVRGGSSSVEDFLMVRGTDVPVSMQQGQQTGQPAAPQ